MPWKPVNEMKLKRDFVELASCEEANMSELCRRFGVSRPTGYKWLKRWKSEGGDGLEQKPRRPAYSPGRTGEKLERAVLEVRDENPVWGGRKIRRRLLDIGLSEVPSASTITSILRRHGRLEPLCDSTPGRPWKRFEKEAPNQLWQMDFKGHFGLAQGGRCHPLGVLDDHSRFNLVLAACENQRRTTVQPVLTEAFRRYGLPDRILCDNGAPWGNSGAATTQLEYWLLELGVDVTHGRPCHPQTQGKEERFHRTLQAEVISRRTQWRDLQECEEQFGLWREKYNHQRPHEALDDRVPGAVYRASQRTFPEHIPKPESHYLDGDEMRKVKSKGEITFRNRFFTIGAGLQGKTVALRPSGEEKWEVFFCWKRLGVVDLSRPAKPKFHYESIKDLEEEITQSRPSAPTSPLRVSASAQDLD